MKEAMKKEQILMYAEELLYPEIAETLTYCETRSDEEGDTDIWLLESDAGNEYWVMEGTYPTNMIRKSGIYTDVARAFAAYVEMAREVEEMDPVLDRFHQPLV